MGTKRLDGRLPVAPDIDQHHVFRGVADEQGIVVIGVVMIAIIRQVDPADHLPIFIGQSDLRDLAVLNFLDNGLRFIGSNGPVVPGPPVLEKIRPPGSKIHGRRSHPLAGGNTA